MSELSPDPSLRASNVIRLFEEFLNALCDPEAGSHLYEVHAADAALRWGDGVKPAAAVDAAAFASEHRDISLRGQGALPRYCGARLLDLSAEGPTGEAIAWFQVDEPQRKLSLPVAVGFVATASKPMGIRWCIGVPQVKRWSYREGLLQSLVNYPWMRRGTPVRPRALLDASFFRHYWRAPLTFQTLPDARFSCMMSAVCCKHDYEITLPPEAQMLIDAVPWDRVEPRLSGTRLPVRTDGQLQLKTLNEHCRFLGHRHQCLIHQTLGRQPFGPCSVFPFSFAHTPDGVAVALSPICGAARRGIGVAPLNREEDLRDRFVQSEARRTDRYRLATGVEVPWETFRNTEKALCECLASQGIPLRRRLYLGARLLGALRDGEPLNMNLWLNEPLPQITAELREAIRGMLAKILGWDRAALQALPANIPATVAGLEAHDPQVVARILQNTLFSKVYSYPFDLTTAHNFLIVLYLLALLMQAASPGGVLPDVLWQELGSLGVHGLLKFLLHEGVPDGFRVTFGTAEFGQWMLAV
jgi:hypothetical protein